MGRKFSQKISKKALLQGIAVFVFFAITTTLLFQNCSQVSVSDMTVAGKEEQARILRVGAGEVVVEVGASQYGKAEADFNVGLNQVPNLRQMWILDNSGTMEANNLNLSSSFGTLFDQNNKDSLYKFDTTAYLFSTAQAIPSYVTGTAADKAVIVDVSDRQGLFFGLPNISEAHFNTELRTSDLNSGRIPGDNVGISIRRMNGKNDFSVLAAPVLSKKTAGDYVVLTAPINKPANTSTINFETEFKEKLAILKSSRVPSTLVGQYYVQQSAPIIDKESGLCAVARILENPNSMYTPSDLLAFTIVTDENEGDINGVNCLKRTANLQADYDVINGKCSEYETGFNYQVTTNGTSPTTCTVSGKTGYTARFDYINYWANVSYRVQTQTGGATTYTIPQTEISYEFPRTKTQIRKTEVAYHTRSLRPETYSYSRYVTTVNYYTRTCTSKLIDGIPQETCTPDANRKSIQVYGDKRSTCAQVAASLEVAGKTITQIQPPNIGADKLPNCELPAPAFTAYLAAPTCDVADTVNCRRQEVTAAFYALDSGERRTANVVGDQIATDKCHAAATSANANAVVVTSTGIGADKLPICRFVWTDGVCSPGAADCQSVPDSNGTGNYTVRGTITDGSASCYNHQLLPSNAIKTAALVNCSGAAAESNSGPCPANTIELGCTTNTTVDQFAMSSAVNKPGLRTASECYAWATSQSNQKVRDMNDVVCDLKTPAAQVKSSLAFNAVSDNGSLLGLESSCGQNQAAFYSALNQQDKDKISASTTCKIDSYTSASRAGISLTAATCENQKATDCSNYGIRTNECTASQIAGTAMNTPGPVTPHAAKLNMKANCNTKCNMVINGFCEASSNQDISIRDYLAAKYGATGKTVSCSVASSIAKTQIDTILSRPVSQIQSFCPTSGTGIPRYFDAQGGAYRTNTAIDEFVAGTTTNTAGLSVPAKPLIKYIKDKIAQDELNVNFTVFIRRTGETVGTGNGIDYIGKHYEDFISEVGGQIYSVTTPSYSDALKNLSAVIKSKLIRSFTISAMAAHQVITSVTIVRANGSQNLAIGQWTQSGQSITIANGVLFDEGDKIIVKFQNDDGYIKAQLKKMFIIDEMRPEQIVTSVEHIKASGETVLLRTDQWLKDQNTISIDPAVVINGGDQFRIRFKNNTTEE